LIRQVDTLNIQSQLPEPIRAHGIAAGELSGRLRTCTRAIVQIELTASDRAVPIRSERANHGVVVGYILQNAIRMQPETYVPLKLALLYVGETGVGEVVCALALTPPHRTPKPKSKTRIRLIVFSLLPRTVQLPLLVFHEGADNRQVGRKSAFRYFVLPEVSISKVMFFDAANTDMLPTVVLLPIRLANLFCLRL
jgi:hypothetical protein